jgi:glycosyltransferase involved in cell wall biosynthesis
LNVVKLPFGAGIFRGRNAAFQETTSDYILLLDDDHYVPSNIFELKEILDEDTKLGGVSTYLEEDGEIFCEAGDFKLDEYVKKGIFDIKDLKRFKKN